MNAIPRLSAWTAAVAGTAALLAAPVSSALMFDQNVTPDVIFGSGNANGSFTTDTRNNVEIGLRGKLRHDATGAPANTFNSNGDGTYSFAAGVAPTQAFPTAVWSFEWSINTDLSGTSGVKLNGLTYRLGLDTDTSTATNFSIMFDPIHANDPHPLGGVNCWDHSMGNNSTANGAGVEVLAADCRSGVVAAKIAAAVQYAANIGTYNVAQNSWKAHWFFGPGFDPTVDATYDIYLAAFNPNGAEVARSQIQIIVGRGGAEVPAPATLALLGLGMLGLGAVRRYRS